MGAVYMHEYRKTFSEYGTVTSPTQVNDTKTPQRVPRHTNDQRHPSPPPRAPRTAHVPPLFPHLQQPRPVGGREHALERAPVGLLGALRPLVRLQLHPLQRLGLETVGHLEIKSKKVETRHASGGRARQGRAGQGRAGTKSKGVQPEPVRNTSKYLVLSRYVNYESTALGAKLVNGAQQQHGVKERKTLSPSGACKEERIKFERRREPAKTPNSKEKTKKNSPRACLAFPFSRKKRSHQRLERTNDTTDVLLWDPRSKASSGLGRHEAATRHSLNRSRTAAQQNGSAVQHPFDATAGPRQARSRPKIKSTTSNLRLVVKAGPLDVAADLLRGRAVQELAGTHGRRRRRGGLGEVDLGQGLQERTKARTPCSGIYKSRWQPRVGQGGLEVL